VELQAHGVVTKDMVLAPGPAAKLHTLVVLSEKMPSDAGFARRARKKYVS
jgi:hypothetical protein